MSEENVEAIKRAADAYNRGDVDAVLQELDPEIEWHPLLQVLLGGEATVYRGNEAVPEIYGDSATSAMDEKRLSRGRSRARRRPGGGSRRAW